MSLLIECVIMSYPPAIIKRVEELPQYKDTIKSREKAHVCKKLIAIVVFVVVLAALAFSLVSFPRCL